MRKSIIFFLTGASRCPSILINTSQRNPVMSLNHVMVWKVLKHCINLEVIRKRMDTSHAQKGCHNSLSAKISIKLYIREVTFNTAAVTSTILKLTSYQRKAFCAVHSGLTFCFLECSLFFLASRRSRFRPFMSLVKANFEKHSRSNWN
jgi:hypothetical protein